MLRRHYSSLAFWASARHQAIVSAKADDTLVDSPIELVAFESQDAESIHELQADASDIRQAA